MYNTLLLRNRAVGAGMTEFSPDTMLLIIFIEFLRYQNTFNVDSDVN